MAQAVAVWAEDLGCSVTYRTYTGNERVPGLLSGEWDVAFISVYTRAAYAAYAVSRLLRASGAVTALGGPHAAAYPEDSARSISIMSSGSRIAIPWPGSSTNAARPVKLRACVSPRPSTPIGSPACAGAEDSSTRPW